MDDLQKLLMRAAALIHQVLSRRGRKPAWRLPTDAWDDMKGIAGQIELARQHGWHRAAASRTQDLAFSVDSCQRRLAELATELRKLATRPSLATEADIYRDLRALQEEFEQVSCDLQEQEIRAETAPIELEGHYLGRFEIRFSWDRIDLSGAYRVVALDPNPSSRGSHVTHPHVSDEHLCEGEGRLAIRSALDQGRIGDFFLIVLNLLKTYSPGNAYVELDDWDGSSCSNCDSSCTSEDLWSCESCGESLCNNCSIPCDACGESYCSGCISGCTGCDSEFCSACLKKCQQCNTSVCADCLQEGSLCQHCFDKQQSLENHDGVTSEPAIHQTPGITAITIQPNRLGQAAVSPRPRDERDRWIRRNAA